MVCIEHTIGSVIILDAPDETLGDVGLVESHFFLFRDGVNVNAIYVPGLPQMYHWLRNHFGCT
jgi:hypothetical protein